MIMSGESESLSSAFSSRAVTALRSCLASLMLCVGAGLASAGDTPSAGMQDMSVLSRSAEAWLRAQTTARYPDTEVTVEVSPPDERLRLTHCDKPLFSLPANARLWDTGSLGIRCESTQSWSLYTPYRISISGPALVSRRALRARQGIGADDVVAARVAYQASPESYVHDVEQLRGSVLSVPVAAGGAIRADMLRRPQLIKAGQKTRIIVEGPGYSVTQEGIAQQQGAAGDSIRLKTTGGRLIQGRIEADGTVRVEP